MQGKIMVVGSSNTDMVIKAGKFPSPGETILGGEFLMNPGGKGANQAVAAARLGGQVMFVAKVGSDIFGQQALHQFRNEGIDTEHVRQDTQHPSGVALITVDAQGENTIVVAQGANGALSEQDILQAESQIQEAEIVLVQLEIPLGTVTALTRLAKLHARKIILNPAPAMPLPDEMLKDLYLITPNESEAEALTGIQIKDLTSAEQAAHTLREKGVANVIVTLGARGALVVTDAFTRHVPAPEVKAVDTTAAGDVFNGALAVAVSEGKSLLESVVFANQAAALSVTRMGAQASAPTRQEMAASTG
jgi:ribokinase